MRMTEMMRAAKPLLATAIVVAAGFSAPAFAAEGTAVVVPANRMIANNAAAQGGECQKVCDTVSWNGQWTTTIEGKMSVCGTAYGNFDAGPIWDQADAEKKCPAITKTTFAGSWTNTPPKGTTYHGKGTAVCVCRGATPFTN